MCPRVLAGVVRTPLPCVGSMPRYWQHFSLCFRPNNTRSALTLWSQHGSSPTSDRTPRSARSVYGSEDSRHSSDREIQLLELGSAPSTIELAFASAQRALYDTAALLAASWRADVASPPVGQSAVEPAAPGARAAQGGRQRARRGRGGQGKKRGAS